VSRRSGERIDEADGVLEKESTKLMLRLMGEFLLIRDNSAVEKAEQRFRAGIGVAREQGPDGGSCARR
jgi:hypothetical protein